jgi:hypothetical protein
MQCQTVASTLGRTFDRDVNRLFGIAPVVFLQLLQGEGVVLGRLQILAWRLHDVFDRLRVYVGGCAIVGIGGGGDSCRPEIAVEQKGHRQCKNEGVYQS